MKQCFEACVIRSWKMRDGNADSWYTCEENIMSPVLFSFCFSFPAVPREALCSASSLLCCPLQGARSNRDKYVMLTQKKQNKRKFDTLSLFSTFNLFCSYIFQSNDNFSPGHTKMSSWDGIAPSITHFGKSHTRHSSTWSITHGINICNTTQKKVLETQCTRGYQMCL